MSLKCGMEKEVGGRVAEPMVLAGLSFPHSSFGLASWDPLEMGMELGRRCFGAEGAVPFLGEVG